MCSVLLLPEVTVSRDFEVEGSLQYQMICGANKIHGVDKSLAGRLYLSLLKLIFPSFHLIAVHLSFT